MLHVFGDRVIVYILRDQSEMIAPDCCVLDEFPLRRVQRRKALYVNTKRRIPKNSSPLCTGACFTRKQRYVFETHTRRPRHIKIRFLFSFPFLVR